MIQSGSSFGPYEIVNLIGAGGMGEVYRARDRRLDRDVALKILPADFAGDPDRLRRFEQEARAVGQLSHPNILALYDLGTCEGIPYLVAELLEGKTLRAELEGAALSPRRVVELGVQVASGLAAAHAKGIVHRDLKPENLFVTPDGRVKILDFGLAKLSAPARGHEAGPEAKTLPADTAPGAIAGTAGYMSPEQVRGQVLDHRSDLFSFGVVLYEMIAGKAPFHRETAAETMTSILREEPQRLTELIADLPLGLARTVEHCLEKSPERRFQSASDLGFALESLSGQRAGGPSGTGGREVPATVPTRPAPVFQQLTFRRGHVVSARFGPDNHTIVYSALWDGNPFEIFTVWPAGPESRSLGLLGSDLLSVSSSGELALGVRRRYVSVCTFSSTLARAPLGGGAPREILENVEWADWSPDGLSQALVHGVPPSTRLEWPAGIILHETNGAISHPRVSPAGDLVAFLEHPIRGNSAGSVAVVSRKGEVRTLSAGWPNVNGLAWSPGGEEIWFTAMRTGHDQHLRAVSLSGEERVVLAAPGWLTLHDVARDGRVLLAHESSRRGMMGRAPGAEGERDLSWLDWSRPADISRDGLTVLFDESGVGGGEEGGVFLRGLDGSSAVRLGEGLGRTLSPDGKWVLSLTTGRERNCLLLPTGAGERRVLPCHGLSVRSASLHPDGRRIFVAGGEPGVGARVHVIDIESGETRPLDPECAATWVGRLSPDGRHLFLLDTEGNPAVWNVLDGVPAPAAGLERGNTFAGWGADARSLYLYPSGQMPVRVFRLDSVTGEREPQLDLQPADSTGIVTIGPVCLTPDGAGYVYSYLRFLSTLYLANGLA
jgi:eukaryotic-like serine/threonine-protein kinase